MHSSETYKRRAPVRSLVLISNYTRQAVSKPRTRKVTWLAQDQNLVSVILKNFGTLIEIDKLGKDDDVLGFPNRDSEHSAQAWADCNVSELEQGVIIQLEGHGYFRMDQSATAASHATFFKIPTGKDT